MAVNDSAAPALGLPVSRASSWLACGVPFILGLVTFGLVLLTSQTVFPYLSNNHDEGVYLFHAHMLEQGKLWVKPPAHSDFFNAWFLIKDEGRLYPKYVPVFPAVLAAADILFKDMRVALALIGAVTVVVLYLVAQEMYRRHVALLSSIFLVFSPLFLIQASVFLSYMLSFLLNLLFLLCFLKSVRRGGLLYPLLAGLSFGVAAFARPYTALLFALPVAGYALYLAARGRLRLPTIAVLLISVLPGVALTLGYNNLMTGSAFQFPFNTSSPQDTLGFGTKQMWSNQALFVYTPSAALESTQAALVETVKWIFGGLFLLVLAGLSFMRRRWNSKTALLTGITASVIIGNTLQWGTLNITFGEAPLSRLMGPFYYVDLLLPLCLLGALGFFDAVRLLRQPWRRGERATFKIDRSGAPSLTTAVVLALTIPLVAVTAYLLGHALDANFRYTVKHATIYSPFVNGRLESALVFLPTPYGPFIHHPFGYLLNDPSFNGPVVYARDLGNKNLELMKAMPDRRAYVYLYQGKFTERAEDVAPVSLLRIQPVEGRFLSVDMEAVNTTNRPFVWAYVWNDEKTLTYLLDDQSGAGKTYRFRWYLAADRLYFDGPNKGRVDAAIQDLSGKTTLNVAVAFSSTRERKEQEIFEYRYWFAKKDGVITLGAPGQPWRDTAWPSNAWLSTDISSTLRAGAGVVPGS